MNEYLHVFVYGTLKPGEANFDRYCGNEVINTYSAYIYAKLYHLRQLGYPAIIHGTSKVHGFVLCFADSKILPQLDELEDYDPHRQPTANEYTRELVTTYSLDDTASISAWAYFMTAQKVQHYHGIHIPDGWWKS